jgi:hypothetical protein
MKPCHLIFPLLLLLCQPLSAQQGLSLSLDVCEALPTSHQGVGLGQILAPSVIDNRVQIFDYQAANQIAGTQKPRPKRASDDPRLGVRGAAGLASFISRGGNVVVATNNRFGLTLGPLLDVPVSDLFFFQTGLMYSLRGGISSQTNARSVSTLHYLQVPANLGVKFDLDVVKPYLLFGPYLSVALAGRVKTEGNRRTVTETVSFGNSFNDDLRRIDFGLTFGGGVELGEVPLQIFVAYDLGLANLQPSGAGFTTRGRMFFFGINFFFE